MSRITRYTTIGALAASVLLLASCSAESATEPTKTVTVTAPAPAPSKPEEPASEQQEPKEKKADPAASEAAPTTAHLPDMTGQTLQAAQDGAQAAGFWMLAEEDATGQSRIPLWDRGWTVCSQAPAAGEHDTTTTVTFHVVKDIEVCP